MKKPHRDDILIAIGKLPFEEQMQVLEHLLVMRDKHEFDAKYKEVLPEDTELGDLVAFALRTNEQSSDDDIPGSRWIERFNQLWDASVEHLRLWEKAAIWCAVKKPFQDIALQAVFLAHCSQASKYFTAGWRAAAYQIAQQAQVTNEQSISLTHILLSDSYLRLYVPRDPENVLSYWAFGSRVLRNLEQFDIEAFLEEKAGQISDPIWRIWICLRLAHHPLSLDELSEKVGIPGDKLYQDYLVMKKVEEGETESGQRVQTYAFPPTFLFVSDRYSDPLWRGKPLPLERLLESELAS